MALQLIIGGSGSGKTTFLYDRIIGESIRHPKQRYFMIVPEQFTMQTQKDIVTRHPSHGTMNIDIVSFERLAYRVFEELAVENLHVLDDMGKSMVLRKVAGRHRRELVVFQGHLDQSGFVGKLKSMISEFYQYGITPQMLREVAADAGSALFRQKLEDFAVVFQAFRDYIEGHYIAAEEVLDVLCRVLPRSEIVKNSMVSLDGFTGFTPVQYRLLELFMVYARQVQVTVTADSGEPLRRPVGMQNLFYMSHQMVRRLVGLAGKNQVPVLEDICLKGRPRFEKAPELAFLEQNLFRYRKARYQEAAESDSSKSCAPPAWPESTSDHGDGAESETGQVSLSGSGTGHTSQPGAGNGCQPQPALELFQASSPSEEIARMVHRMQELVRDQGMRYRDMAVITGDLAGYGREIAHEFEQNGIPYFMDDRANILDNPMVELIRSALEVVRRDFSYESVFRFLRTGLVTQDREMTDRMENYVLAMGIRGHRRWREPWERTYRGGASLNLVELNAFRDQALAPLFAMQEAFGREKITIGGMAGAVQELLHNCQAEEKMLAWQEYFTAVGEYRTAREYGQIYGMVTELLERLTDLLGEEQAGRKEFMEILDAGFGELSVGVIPATVDRVVVGDIVRTRLAHIRVLFFLGVNDGIVPARQEKGSLLSDQERDFFTAHSLELAPTAREDSFQQRFYLYLMMTKPRERLVVSYAGVGPDGRSRRASYLVGELRKMFPSLALCSGEGDPESPCSVPEARRLLVAGLGHMREEDWREGEYEKFQEIYRWFVASGDYEKELNRLVDAAFYVYESRGIGHAVARALYGSVISGSVTRLEQYASCAYAHFLKYGLELMERQHFEIGAADMGNLFHDSIDLCFRQMEEKGLDWRTVTGEERTALVRDCVEQVTAEYGNRILGSSSRNSYLAKRVEHIAQRTVWALQQQIRKGDFTPAGFEVSFSAADNLKAMRIALSEEEEIRLRGRVDRMDLCEDGEKVYVKIIDYKSGSTHFDLMSLYYGLQLQLVVYMDAVMEMTERRYPGREVVPAGILYYNIADPLVDKNGKHGGDSPEDIDREILKQLRMNGLVNSELEAIRHLDHTIEKESDIIPVVLKDGEVQAERSQVASGARFEKLRQFVHRKVASAGREILDGAAEVDPFKRGDRTACDYCPFHPVCGFDKKTAGYEYRKLRNRKTEEIWEEVCQEIDQ